MPVRGCDICGAPACKRHKRRSSSPRRRYSDTARYREVLIEVLERDGDSCAYCRLPTSDADRVLAHVIAHDDGGAFDPNNLRIAHRSCNAEAGKTPPPQEVPTNG